MKRHLTHGVIPGSSETAFLESRVIEKNAASGVFFLIRLSKNAIINAAGITLLLCALLFIGNVEALTCTFNWSPITVDVDGNPVTGVQYRIRYYPVGSFNPQTFIDPATIGVVATCPPGLYYVGAYNVANGQSPGGDIVQVRAVNVKMIRSSTN